MTCTFFGHSNAPQEICPLLHNALTKLIEEDNVDTFYVGNQGAFDAMVRHELKNLVQQYPHIRYTVVLAYMPTKRDMSNTADKVDTVYPNGLETVPRKFAIDKRNRIMLNWSDIVVTYVCYTGGGAAKFKKLAEQKGKQVIDLCAK